MKKSEYLNNLRIDKMGEHTVFIQNKYFNFSYTNPDLYIRDELKTQYRYFGGLQCEFDEDSEDYKRLENYLCGIAESIFNTVKSL